MKGVEGDLRREENEEKEDHPSGQGIETGGGDSSTENLKVKVESGG